MPDRNLKAITTGLPTCTAPISEKLNLSTCRYALGVHKKAQNNPTRGDLGRYPLGVDIIANIMKYHTYLQAKVVGSLMYEE